MAKKITAIVRLQIPTARLDTGPAASRALSRHGVNMTAFSRAFHAMKPDDGRPALPAVVTIYEDTSFSLVLDASRGTAAGEPAVAV